MSNYVQSQRIKTDTLKLSSYVSEEVCRRELITIHSNVLTLKSKSLDSLISNQSNCNILFNEDRISHFSILIDDENQQLKIFIEEGIPDYNSNFCGVSFLGEYNIPYLIYSSSFPNIFFCESEEKIVIQYMKLFDVKNQDLSNEIQLIDEKKIHSGEINEINLIYYYFVESCY
jgi:hypothetical protein